MLVECIGLTHRPQPGPSVSKWPRRWRHVSCRRSLRSVWCRPLLVASRTSDCEPLSTAHELLGVCQQNSATGGPLGAVPSCLVGHRSVRRRRRSTKGYRMTRTITTRLEAIRRARDEAGMTTAEYAVGTVGACGFAGLLFQLLTSQFGTKLLTGLFDKALDLLPF